MATLALAQSFGCASRGEEFAFIGLPPKHAAKQLSSSAEEVVRNIATILDQLIMRAIDQRTGKDFVSLREEVFPDYAKVIIALSNIVATITPPRVIDRLVAESLNELEAEFRDHARAAFGEHIREQAIFTVWTLRKISDCSRQIISTKPSEEMKAKDSEMATMFAYHGIRTRFHLDCLTASMRHQRPIYPEVLEQISSGLRSVVDAYAWIRQGLELRFKADEPELPFVDLDEEDRQFIDASALDMANDLQ